VCFPRSFLPASVPFCVLSLSFIPASAPFCVLSSFLSSGLRSLLCAFLVPFFRPPLPSVCFPCPLFLPPLPSVCCPCSFIPAAVPLCVLSLFLYSGPRSFLFLSLFSSSALCYLSPAIRLSIVRAFFFFSEAFPYSFFLPSPFWPQIKSPPLPPPSPTPCQPNYSFLFPFFLFHHLPPPSSSFLSSRYIVTPNCFFRI
jgi:hypothetical protein